MSKLLYIESSPRKNRSSSIKIANVFLDEYKKSHPKDVVDVIDLWKVNLPEFDGDTIDAKYAIMNGKKYTDAQAKAWKHVEDVIASFKSADKYVFSLPMWNFGIPYKLKHYLDVIIQPGYTFSASSHGSKGLIEGKKALLIYSRGGAYGPGTGAEQFDLQKRYMETALGYIGLTNLQSIIIEPTLAGEDKKEASLKKANEEALSIAAKF